MNVPDLGKPQKPAGVKIEMPHGLMVTVSHLEPIQLIALVSKCAELLARRELSAPADSDNGGAA